MKNSAVKIESCLQTKTKVGGVYTPPPDKSITHRAVFLGSLSPRRSVIRNPLLSEDCLSTVECFRKLGVPIRVTPSEIRIEAEPGNAKRFREFKKPHGNLNCGNSGTTMRLLAGVLAAQPFTTHLVGDRSLSRRPMRRVIEPLKQMGALVGATRRNCAPLVVRGTPRLHPIVWKSPVASAQVKSSILLAGLFAPGATTVQEPARSRDHTERMLRSQGAKISFDAFGPPQRQNRVTVWGGGSLSGLNLTVPGDFSSAAFLIAAACLVPGSDLEVRGVNLNPTRIGFLQQLKKMGARIAVSDLKRAGEEPVGNLRVRACALRGAPLSQAEVPLMIDEVPILAVVATQAKGRTVISGAEELRVKESDRLSAIASELRKMGARIQERPDGLLIEGPTVLRGTPVQSYEDHRIAMALAVAALVAEGRTEIRHFDCVKISYPQFLAHFFQALQR